MVSGDLNSEIASLWNAEILEPVDCGLAPECDVGLAQVVAGRKVRPISLAEAWIKLADKIAVAFGAKNFRAQIEPVQLGAGYPDGVVAVVRSMRRWATAIEEAAQWCAENGDMILTPEGQAAAAQAECVLVGADLRNAFGNMYRSGAIGAVERLCPTLARLLASSWAQGTVLWARTGPRQWASCRSFRGGAQGRFPRARHHPLQLWHE